MRIIIMVRLVWSNGFLSCFANSILLHYVILQHCGFLQKIVWLDNKEKLLCTVWADFMSLGGVSGITITLLTEPRRLEV